MGKFKQCKFFFEILVFVATDFEFYICICFHNIVVEKMHNIPVKTVGFVSCTQVIIRQIRL